MTESTPNHATPRPGPIDRTSIARGGVSHDCPPTLDDQGVIDFCRSGYLILPGVVSDEINRRVVDYLDDVDDSAGPDLTKTDWFVDGVFKNPQAAGAVRSLLGRDYLLPVRIANHRGPLPCPDTGGWHRDAGAIYTPALDYLQVFYYPEACTEAMGPTEVLPGSHFVRTKHNMMSHFGKIAGAVSTACVAGTIFVTVYGIWHRRTRATSGPTGRSAFRNLLKYDYWRTTAPTRDWITEPPIDIGAVDFSPPDDRAMFEQGQGAIAAAGMFAWLSGVDEQYLKLGGQCWPLGPIGMPEALHGAARKRS
ncbi:MAG: hypothetical protein CMJ18_20075 [Phycisphaeraceae bacterium]|nr:hypothetical protein [Phycisphaeraceae bacterium]